MTQAEKQLLFKDLCARLFHGVKILHRGSVQEIAEISPDGYFKNRNYNAWFNIETCKPYLRPMSSMTEEEEKEFEELFIGYSISRDRNCVYHSTRGDLNLGIIDWFNAHHFDYRGLIPMGLALEAPEGMY